jgi:hypothetical protein
MNVRKNKVRRRGSVIHSLNSCQTYRTVSNWSDTNFLRYPILNLSSIDQHLKPRENGFTSESK